MVMFAGAGATAQEADTGPGNRALIDTEATSEARDAATELCEELFTFSYTDLDGHEEKFGSLTTGDFSRRYSELFGSIASQARAQRMSLTSTVREAAVRVLRADEAEVLVFLDQTSSRGDTGQHTASAAVFSTTITRTDGDWKVADMDLFEDR
jgi:Mce-associated membrane protein